MSKQKVANIADPTPGLSNEKPYDCPHCGRSQVVRPRIAEFKGAQVTLWQCLACSELQVNLEHRTAQKGGLGGILSVRGFDVKLYPSRRARPPKQFAYVPKEISAAYDEACLLFGIHAGAAGAYARRCLELLLDGMGYQAKTILGSIDLARTEADYDKRLPKRYLDRLDYIKEVGNFALHVRRDHELAIIEVDKEQVSVCLDIIESLLDYVFEDPGQQYAKAVEMNEALKKASKKELPLPEAPGWLWSEEAAHAELDEDSSGGLADEGR